VRWSRNPHLVWVAIVLTMFQPRLAIHSAFAESMREAYGELVLNASVPFNVAFKECIVARKPLAFWKPKGARAKAVDAIAGEILARVEKVRSAGREAA
jgi:chromosome partitioning protein